MNFFTRFLARTLVKSRTFQAVMLRQFAKSPITTRTLHSLAKTGYERNPYVYAAITLRQDAVGKMPPRLYRVVSGGQAESALYRGYRSKRDRERVGLRKAGAALVQQKAAQIRRLTGCPSSLARSFACKALVAQGELEEVPVHPILDLLHRPNAYYQTSYSELVESYVGFHDLFGETFTEPIVYETGAQAGQPFEIYMLPPDDFTAIAGQGVPIDKWRYRQRDLTFNFSPDPNESEIWFDKRFNPHNPARGLSPLIPAGRAVDLMNESEAYNLTLVRNGAFPPTVLYNKSQKRRWSRQDRDDFRDEWDDELAGPDNAGKPMLLDGDVGAINVGGMPKDLMFHDTVKMSARQVAVIYRVAPELLGDDTKTYANYEQARRGLYVESALPTADRMYRHWNSTLVPRFGNDLILDYDAEQVEELQDDVDAIFERMEGVSFLSLNEKRAAIGYEDYEPGDGIGDTILVPASMVPLQALGSGDVPLDVGGDGLPDDVDVGVG